MQNIVASAGQSRFPVKLVCCIAFGSASSYWECCVLIYCIVTTITHFLHQFKSRLISQLIKDISRVL